MATLRHAFEAMSLPALVVKILKGEYTPLPSAYSSDLRDLVGSMLRTNPDVRVSVNDVLSHNAMKPYLSGSPLEYVRPRFVFAAAMLYVAYAMICRQEPLEKRQQEEAKKFLQRQQEFARKKPSSSKPTTAPSSKPTSASPQNLVPKLQLDAGNNKSKAAQQQPPPRPTPPTTPRTTTPRLGGGPDMPPLRSPRSSVADIPPLRSPRSSLADVPRSPRGADIPPLRSPRSALPRSESARSVSSVPDNVYRHRPQSFPMSPPSPRIIDGVYIPTPRPSTAGQAPSSLPQRSPRQSL